MTLHHTKHGITFECDGCDETLDADTRTFAKAIEVMREEGWKAEKVADEWLHLCQDCKRSRR